jgi:EpsI family protein
MRLFTVILVLAAGSVAVRSVGHGEAVALSRPFWQYPNEIEAWSGYDVRLTQAIADKAGVTSYMYRIFARAEKRALPVHLYVGFYESQKHGEMIHSPKNCLPGNGWFIEERDRMVLDVPPYEPFEVNKFIIANGIERQLVLYWYQQAGGRVVTNEYLGRVHLVVDALTKNRTDAALIRIIVPMADTEEASIDASTREAVAFLQASYPELMRFLPHDRPRRADQRARAAVNSPW